MKMKQININDWKEPDFGTHETGMKVPEGFFEGFRKNLELKIDEFEAGKARQEAPAIRPASRRIPWWSVAASVALIAGLFAWFSPRATSPAGPADTNMPAIAEANTETTDLSESMMLASLSDYDIYEALYVED